MDVFINIWNVVVAYAYDNGLSTIISLAAVNFLLGVSVAIKDRVFDVNKLGDIFAKIAPMLVAYVAVDLFYGSPEMAAMMLAVIVATLTGNAAKNIAALFPTLPQDEAKG